jgi:hypothetical protein
VTTTLTPIPTGGSAAVSLPNPAQIRPHHRGRGEQRSVARGFDPQADDYVFTKDASGVVAAMAQPGPPIPTTGAASPIADHGATVNGTVDPHINDTTWSVEYGLTTRYSSHTAPQTCRHRPSAPPPSPDTCAAQGAQALSLPGRREQLGGCDGRQRHDLSGPRANVTKPKVTLTVKRQRVARVRARGLVYAARCSERCTGPRSWWSDVRWPDGSDLPRFSQGTRRARGSREGDHAASAAGASREEPLARD